MRVPRRDYEFRIVDTITHEIVEEDQYGLSDRELERMKESWSKKCEKLGWKYFLIVSLYR